MATLFVLPFAGCASQSQETGNNVVDQLGSSEAVIRSHAEERVRSDRYEMTEKLLTLAATKGEHAYDVRHRAILLLGDFPSPDAADFLAARIEKEMTGVFSIDNPTSNYVWGR